MEEEKDQREAEEKKEPDPVETIAWVTDEGERMIVLAYFVMTLVAILATALVMWLF